MARVLIVTALVLVVALALIYMARATRRHGLEKADAAARWEVVTDDQDPRGHKTVLIKRVSRYKSLEYTLSRVMVAEKIPPGPLQEIEVLEAQGRAIALADGANRDLDG